MYRSDTKCFSPPKGDIMTRPTQRDLDGLINRLNRMTGNNPQPWSNGKSNIGTYCLDNAYGGNKLVQIVNEGGGERNITHGYVSKRECYVMIAAYIAGIEDCIKREELRNKRVKGC